MDEAGAAESTGIIGSRVADKRCVDTKRILLFVFFSSDVRPALFKGFKQAKRIYVIYLSNYCSYVVSHFYTAIFIQKRYFPAFNNLQILILKSNFIIYFTLLH